MVGLAGVTSDRQRLVDVVQQKLARLELPAAVRRMELVSGTLRALSAASLDAFAGLAGAGGRDTAPQLVERLRARLGEERRLWLCLINEHRPEAAWRRVSELPLNRPEMPANRAVGAVFADTQMPRPVWLLAEPLPLDAARAAAGSGAHRERLVGRQGRGARLLHGAVPRARQLWVYQERQTQRWYPARRVRVTPPCTPSCMPEQFLVPARRLASRRSWSSRRRRSAIARWRSPTNARWPASCARTWPRASAGCR